MAIGSDSLSEWTTSSRPLPRPPAVDAGIVWPVWFGSCWCKPAGVWVFESIITSNCAMYANVSCRTAVTSERPATFHTKIETRCSLRCCWLAAPYCEGARDEGPAGPGPEGGGGSPAPKVPPTPAMAAPPPPAKAAAAASAAWAAALTAEAEVAPAYEVPGPL